MTRTAPRIATFIGETFFVDALAAHILEHYDHKDDPAALGRITVCVPTRRAVQSVKDTLIALRPHGTFLPQLLTIAELSPLHVLPADATFWQHSPVAVMDSTRRLLAVIELLIQLSHQETYHDIFPSALSVQDALHYAVSFLALRDDFQRASLCYHSVQPDMMGEYAVHWEQTLRLFRALMQKMDDMLHASGMQEPLPHTAAQIQAITDYWQHTPHPYPFIIAGSTGSTPTTAMLMEAIYHHLPHGSILLPAVDMWMEEEAFRQVLPTHAQYNLHHLLEKLKLTRTDVTPLTAGNSTRGLLAAYMLRPYNDTVYFRSPLEEGAFPENNSQQIAYLECDDEIIETEAITLHIRSMLHNGATRIIVISDDDAFTTRLQGLLGSHAITVDISAGIPLAHHPAYHFMLLVAELVNAPFCSTTLLAVLRHAQCSREAQGMRALAAFLDSSILRGMHPHTSLSGLLYHIKHHPSLPDSAIPALTLLTSLTADISEPYHSQPLTALLDRHLHVLSLLGNAEALAEPLAFLSNLAASTPSHLRCSAVEYPRFLWEQCAGKRAGLPPVDAQVHIIGSLELRLQKADALIVPRMNEGVFPASIPADPWLGNAMRRQLGLNYAERKIGLAAHDISTMLRFDHVLFTRSLRECGCHTHASRFFERLKLLGVHTPLTHAIHLLEWVNAYRSYQQTLLLPFPIPLPPCPPLEVRPHSLSATTCESLLQNPFKVYASHICRLRARDPLDDDFNAAYFGQALHRALHRATAHYTPDNLSAYISTLHTAFNEELATLVPAGTEQFHRARLQRILARFIEEEQRRAPDMLRIDAECTYRAPFTLAGGTEIELTARIDRIEHRRDGSIHIIDHKTGKPPTVKEVESLKSCQLLVAGVLLQPASITALEYFDLRGKTNEQDSVSNLVYDAHHAKLGWFRWEDMQDRLLAVLTPFIEDVHTPYSYTPPKQPPKRYDALAHLARVGEWN